MPLVMRTSALTTEPSSHSCPDVCTFFLLTGVLEMANSVSECVHACVFALSGSAFQMADVAHNLSFWPPYQRGSLEETFML